VPLLLVRHAEPVMPDSTGNAEEGRRLSPEGRLQAERLAGELAGEPITAIYSSPYPRARQTVEPLARRLGLAVETVDDLRERPLSGGPLPDWRAHVERAWADFDYQLPGGESNGRAQARIVAALREIGGRHPGETVVAASHGTVIALALHHLRPDEIDVEFWEQIPMPAVFRFEAPPWPRRRPPAAP
jgi:2,3-bisphosphoglycerate-dependent phosphoglycerate mutase